jgi:hypothetical protein
MTKAKFPLPQAREAARVRKWNQEAAQLESQLTVGKVRAHAMGHPTDISEKVRKTEQRLPVMIARDPKQLATMEDALQRAAPRKKGPGRPHAKHQYAALIQVFARMREQGINPPRYSVSLQVCQFPGFVDALARCGIPLPGDASDGPQARRDKLMAGITRVLLAKSQGRKFARIADAL